MSGILVVAEERDGELRDVTLEVIGAARELGARSGLPVAAAVVSPGAEAVAGGLEVEGVAEVVLVTTAQPTSDAMRGAVAALVRDIGPRVVLAGFTVDAMGWAPAVAAELGLGFASDVVACDLEQGRVAARREFYGGKVQAELEFPGAETVLLLLRPTAWAPAAGPGSPARRSVAAPAAPARVRHREYLVPPRGEVDIASADVVLSIGRGIGGRENIATFEELAERLGAVLACSRPLVDAGWMPAARQVGQSGNTVKPKLYLALGISGAVQHLAGMKASGAVVAVNSDPEAPIFAVADYGAVADLFDVAEELRALT